MKHQLKIFFTAVVALFFTEALHAQYPTAFLETQRNFPRVAYALKAKEDTLRKQFAAAGLQWPAKEVYLRSFKYDGQLEVWVRNSDRDPFKLFKTYKICAMAGSLGPKRIAGDFQVPEGFYYINQFNPNSTYHLSLGLNYPNLSDRILSDSVQPGGDIYIHGSCVTVGCIPIQDFQIEEVYLIAAGARSNGQDFIPVHIFPIRFSNPKSRDYLAKVSKDDAGLQKFATTMKSAYEYFEKEKKPPVVSVNKQGEYIFME